MTNGKLHSVTELDGVRGYMDSVRIMNDIIREMKEIPELPSEKPQDTSFLQKVEYPSNGGMLTYMSGHEYPYRGFPYFEFVEKIDYLKKISRGMLSGLYHSLKNEKRVKLITLLPSVWVFKKFVHTAIYTYSRLVERSRIKKERYSQAIRELHRAFSAVKESPLRDQLRDLVCMILEFDNAYRYRAQDILAELDKAALKKDPRKEIIRLLELMISRETTVEVKDTWRLFKMASTFLRYDREMLSLLSEVLSNLNLEEFKLSNEDKYYCVPRKDYSFGFMVNPNEEDGKLIRSSALNYQKNQENEALANDYNKKMQLKAQKDQEEQLAMRTLNAEEFERVKKEIDEKAKLLDQEYTKKREAIFDFYITKEQRDLLDRQNKENTLAIEEYNSKLKAIDEKYALMRVNARK